MSFSPGSARWLLAPVACAGLCVALAASAEAPFRFESTPGKLPKTVVPRAYRIDIVPDAAAARFAATEDVDLDVTRATRSITLNALKLDITSATLGGKSTERARVQTDPAAETVTLTFARPVPAGHQRLHIAYRGPITPQPSGLYYNDYPTDGGTRRLLVTQFEATDARRMFPGWDEPVFKATFQLSIVIPEGEVALSNTPEASSVPAGHDAHGQALRRVTFGVTPRMSTYLVALIAGDLEAVRGKSAGVEIAAWAIRGNAKQGELAVRDAEALLPFYNDYFGVPYPLPKLDMIAIPGNFDAGAMENWGAITYIDDALLFNPASSTEGTRQEIYETVAHEMAHQWSGDLVTMAWWDNIWLNEGFASWMETKATDRLQPEWHVWLRSHAAKERAMASDARSTTHPIQAKVANESDIKTLFDDITYQKGSQFIRMIETYLGEDTFRRGMRAYMVKHAYSNATTADLWAELEAASGQPVAAIAATFTEQPGVPLINVRTRCESGETVVELTQQRFTIHDPSAARLTWRVPVILAALGAGGPKVKTALVGGEPELVRFAGCDQPVKVNYGDVGYYRVAYDEASQKRLTAHFEQLPAADRVSLLSDQWALVQAGTYDARSYLELLNHLSGESELVVWNDVLATLRQIDQLERGAPDQAAFRAWARTVVRPLFDRLGWEPKAGEASDQVLLRDRVVAMLGELDDRDVLEASERRFAAFVKNPDSLDPSLRDAVCNNVGRRADQATFDQLRALGRSATGTEDKLRYYLALAAAQDPKFVPQIVAITLTDEVSPARLSFLLITAAALGSDPEAVWRETLGHREALLAKITEDQRERLLPQVAGQSAERSVAEELLNQPGSSATSGGAYEARKAAERIQVRAELKERVLPQVQAWLKSRSAA